MSNSNDFIIEDGVLKKYIGKELNIIVPPIVTSIGDFAFCYEDPIDNSLPLGDELGSIFIPKSITAIGKNAFIQGPMFRLYYEGTEEEWNNIIIESKEEWLLDPEGEVNIEFNCGISDEPNATDDVIYSTSIFQDLVYSNLDDNVSCVVKKFGGNSDVVIANTYRGLPVAIIGINAFAYDDNLRSVTLPNSLSLISLGAFAWCENLSSIVIPDSVTSISFFAFCGCKSLTSLNIPNKVTSILHDTFSCCTSLTSVDIPRSVTKIDHGAFDGCDKLVIKGYAGSYAEQYAKENGIPFEAIEE